MTLSTATAVRSGDAVGNAGFAWDEFDPQRYQAANYGELRDDDRQVVQTVRDFFARHLDPHVRLAEGVDVGTGTNLYPALCMLPFCDRISLVEKGHANVRWLGRQVQDFSADWDPFWTLLQKRSPYQSVPDPRRELARRASVRRGDIFTLPRHRWDLGTMFFVAESITTIEREYDAAVKSFVGSLRPGAPFAAAFMAHSQGYHVAGLRFPAVPVDQADVGHSLAAVATDLTLHRIGSGGPLRDDGAGMIVALGRAVTRYTSGTSTRPKRTGPAPASRSATLPESAITAWTLDEIDTELRRLATAKSRAIDAGDWATVRTLHSREASIEQRRQELPPADSPAISQAAAGKAAGRPVRAGRLPVAAESVAVLIGTASRSADGHWPAIPAIRRNLTDFRDVLRHPDHGGFDAERTHVFRDPDADIAETLARLADATQDTILIYYAGHGIVAEDGQLYLVLPRTRRGFEEFTTLPYDHLRRVVRRSPARNKVVILDCCFAGRAIDVMTDNAGAMPGLLDIRGTYVLAATSATRMARAPRKATHTAFTGELIALLRDGLPNADELIRLSELFAPLHQRLVSNGHPAPQQMGTDTITELALTRNPIWHRSE